MKVKELIRFLSEFPEEAEVVIFKDVDEYGYGSLKSITPGVFETTDYGNDFYPHQGILLNSGQIKSVCLEAEECKRPVREELDKSPPDKH